MKFAQNFECFKNFIIHYPAPAHLGAIVHSCIRAFVHSCIRAFVHSCIRAFVHSCIRAENLTFPALHAGNVFILSHHRRPVRVVRAAVVVDTLVKSAGPTDIVKTATLMIVDNLSPFRVPG
jgi:hypothetical protein